MTVVHKINRKCGNVRSPMIGNHGSSLRGRKNSKPHQAAPQPNGSKQTMWWRRKWRKPFQSSRMGKWLHRGRKVGGDPLSGSQIPFSVCIAGWLESLTSMIGGNARQCDKQSIALQCASWDVHLQGHQPQWPGNPSSRGVGLSHQHHQQPKGVKGPSMKGGGPPA